MGFVYVIHCESSSKSYVGITSKEASLRWKEHVGLMKSGCKKPLASEHRAAVVAAIQSKERRERQRTAMTGRKVSEETKQKMSRAQTGKKRSKRTRDAIWETRWKNELIALIKECVTSL